MPTFTRALACVLLAAVPARARPPCTDGDAHLDAGRFEAAIAAYRAAIDLEACAAAIDGLRVNEAYARERLARRSGRPEDACEALYAWRRALPGASARVAAAVDPSIEAMSAACVLPARLVVTCEPLGATVRIPTLGEARACPASFEGAAPGRHRGVASAAGVDTAFEVELPAGQTTRITVTLHPSPVESLPALEPQPGPPPARHDLAPYAWASAGAALLSGGVAIYGAVRVQQLIDDAEAVNAEAAAFNMDAPGDGDFPALRARAADIRSRHAAIADDYTTMSGLTTGAAIAAGVFAAGAIALFVLDDTPAATGAVRISPGAVSLSF